MYKIRLSPYHKIFYNEWKLDPSSSGYNIVFDQTISADLDVTRLKIALNKFIAEHLLFNSHVLEIDGEPSWIKNSDINQLEFFNDGYTHEQIFEYVSHPFNLNSEPLYRFAVFKEVDGNYRLILVLHHLIIDGNDFDTLVYQISDYYNFTKYFSKISLAEQLEAITTTTEIFDKQAELNDKKYSDFWQSKLSESEALDLRFLKPCTTSTITSSTNPVKELRFNFSKAQMLQLKDVLCKCEITEYIYSQCIFAILLHRYTSQNKFAISYPVSIKCGTNFICGAKINTNLMPFIFRANITVPELFKAITDFIKSLKQGKFNYSYFPIDKIISVANTELLNVTFAQTNLKDMKFNFIDAKTLSINKEFNIDLFGKLCFEQESKEEELNFRVRYNNLETDEIILQNFVKHYQKLFIDILEDLARGTKDTLISEYQLLSNKEYQEVVYDWNNTEALYQNKKIIHQLFEEQVAKTPDNIAVVFEDKKLTYRELNERSNQLASFLRGKYQIKGDDLVAIYLNRSEYMLIAILSILKSGGAYVPIDPSYPTERIKYILEDTQAKVLITASNCEPRVANPSYSYKGIIPNATYHSRVGGNPFPDILTIDNDEFTQGLDRYSTFNPEININSSNLAYIIYTSGTTGQPKGVMVEHNAATNYLNNIKAKIFNNVGNADFSTNIAVDLTVTNTLGALCGGYMVSIYDGDIRDLERYQNHLLVNKVNVVKLTPSYFTLLLGILHKTQINTVILGGEKVSKSILEKVYKPNLIIYDEYGPTETTVGGCLSCVYNNKLIDSTLNIGTPYNNYKMYILSNHGTPLPVGAIGELYIGGAGLARGYLNQYQLTKNAFIVNPFQTPSEASQNSNKRLYKTGDLARYLPNGNLEYIGRNDFQVKIHGVRIELGEIENALNSFAGVKQSVVIVKENIGSDGFKNKYLVAYYTADKVLDESAIIAYMEKTLPSYMVPNIFLWIKTPPLSQNGKLDRNLLSISEFIPISTYVAPCNIIESKICTIFSEVLHLPVDKVGVNHDFFKLGGNSISAINLLYKLQQVLKVNLNDIFNLRIPARIATLAPSAKNSLYNKLIQMKLVYDKLSSYKITPEMQRKKVDYLQKVKQISFKNQFKKIHNILLTGVTGHLGCNILYQLLHETEYKVYLLIRAKTNTAAYNRINKKFKYYFDTCLDSYKNRLVIIAADIEKPNFNIGKEQYQTLVANVDSIIHSAALVKHYGDYDIFYQANVQATINLLELAKYTKLKDFHYISTLSVLTNHHMQGCHYHIWTEDDEKINFGDNVNNVYNKTKYEGELATIKYREFGINSNIYRIGNLAMNSKSYRNQENIEENAFFTRIKAILNLGIITKEISEVEISTVDQTASAIIKLFDKADLINQTYHIYNQHTSNLFELLTKYPEVSIKLTDFNKFIDKMLIYLDSNDNEIKKQIKLFMLHQSLLEEVDLNNLTRIDVLQDRTNYILSNFDFYWNRIDSNMLSDIIKKSLS